MGKIKHWKKIKKGVWKHPVLRYLHLYQVEDGMKIYYLGLSPLKNPETESDLNTLYSFGKGNYSHKKFKNKKKAKKFASKWMRKYSLNFTNREEFNEYCKNYLEKNTELTPNQIGAVTFGYDIAGINISIMATIDDYYGLEKVYDIFGRAIDSKLQKHLDNQVFPKSLNVHMKMYGVENRKDMGTMPNPYKRL